MTTRQRTGDAWKLIRMGPPSKGGQSKAKITEAAGVSDGLLGEMRRVYAKLGEAADGHPNWWNAMKVAKGESMGEWTDEDREAWKQDRANDLADRLRKAWGAPPEAGSQR